MHQSEGGQAQATAYERVQQIGYGGPPSKECGHVSHPGRGSHTWSAISILSIPKHFAIEREAHRAYRGCQTWQTTRNGSLCWRPVAASDGEEIFGSFGVAMAAPTAARSKGAMGTEKKMRMVRTRAIRANLQEEHYCHGQKWAGCEKVQLAGPGQEKRGLPRFW